MSIKLLLRKFRRFIQNTSQKKFHEIFCKSTDKSIFTVPKMDLCKILLFYMYLLCRDFYRPVECLKRFFVSFVCHMRIWTWKFEDLIFCDRNEMTLRFLGIFLSENRPDFCTGKWGIFSGFLIIWQSET